MRRARTVAKRIIVELVSRSQSRVSIRLKSHFPGGRNVGGKYNVNTHSITIYLEEVKKQSVLLFGTLDRFEDVLKIVLAHELGHAEDDSLLACCDLLDHCSTELEALQIALRIEENAWNYASKLLTDVDPEMLHTMTTCSLQSYRDAIAQDIA